jgi:hypothetical protein
MMDDRHHIIIIVSVVRWGRRCVSIADEMQSRGLGRVLPNGRKRWRTSRAPKSMELVPTT